MARAPGTLRNHRSGVKVFLAFCRRLHIDHYHTTFEDICAYLEFLAENDMSPSTIRNKLSQVRVHLSLVGASLASTNHPRVHRALDAMDRDKSHVPRVKSPIEPDVFTAILRNLSQHPLMNIARTGFLFMYYGALRQSEVTSRTVGTWDAKIHPTRGDITVHPSKCVLFVKYGKNLQKVGQYRTVEMASAQDPLLCPVSAMRCVLRDTPTIQPSDPIFMFPDTRKPVPSTFLARVLKDQLIEMDLSSIIPVTSLHSLRKAAASDAFSGGCPELSIKQYGGWSSNAYTAYINTQNQRVNNTLLATLNQY